MTAREPGWYWVKWRDDGEWRPARTIPIDGEEIWGWASADGVPVTIGPRCVPPWETMEEAARTVADYIGGSFSLQQIIKDIRAKAEEMKPK
jgi:hypothetical protein